MPKSAKLARKKKTPVKKVLSKKRVVKIKFLQKIHFSKNKIIGIVFLCLALGILLFPLFIPKKTIENKNPIKINATLYSSRNIINNPVRILIPKANIDLKVVDAQIINGYWELSDNTASYGLGSGHPGTIGNTVIFAHARTGLFYNLKDVKINDIIYVFTKDKWYRYKVGTITAVYPNQTEVLQTTKKEVLTLYTCTGFTDEKRLIVTAIPQS
jgi:LPXTG-site transpeptidase (sortase) family protein